MEQFTIYRDEAKVTAIVERLNESEAEGGFEYRVHAKPGATFVIACYDEYKHFLGYL
jgi:hypothetical protein